MSRDEWTTNSAARLDARRKIRQVIEDWVHGPVELLGEEDLVQLRGVLRQAWEGPRSGDKYVAWCAEVRLALGVPGALVALRGKAKRKRIDIGRVMPGLRDWALERGAEDPGGNA